MSEIAENVTDYDRMVIDIKNSFTSSGVPIVKSDRFTDEELKEFIDPKNSYNSSHIKPGAKRWTDQEIYDQVYTFMRQNPVDELTLNEVYKKSFKSLKYEDLETDRDIVRKILYNRVNRDKPLNVDFWTKFHSMYGHIDEKVKLFEYKQRFGAKGYNEIFGIKSFSKMLSSIFTIHNFVEGQTFANSWKIFKEIEDMKKPQHSDYKDLNHMEEELSVKKIQHEAEKFYLDRSKNWKERLKVFEKYGKKVSSIHHPADSSLEKIFQMNIEKCEHERHETITCSYVIEWWIEQLSENRTHIFEAERGRIKMDEADRNYEPSDKAMDRLEKLYMEKIMLERVASFELDW